jgi:hypothetical protein
MAAKKRVEVEYPVRETESLSVGTTAVGPTSTKIRRGGIIAHALDGDVRWRADGTSPTATVGHPLVQDEEFRVRQSTTVKNLEFISATGATVTVLVSHIG